MRNLSLFLVLFATACAGAEADVEDLDDVNECVFCDERADAFGISRQSYLAYGIVDLANGASQRVLDLDVGLDARAARNIVANRPYTFVEEVDAVPYVGRSAFERLAAYVQAHNPLPYCGDGIVQSLIETCDDANVIDGDGCSALCQADVSNSAVLSSNPLLISGAEIDVPQVDPNAHYFRIRTYKRIYTNSELSFPASPTLLSLLRRADSIQAGSGEDGVVSWDDLALMSKSPFYDVLLDDEKVALEQAWEIFKISDAPIVEMKYTGPSLSSALPMRVDIVRPGPLVVPNTLRVADVDFSTIARRIQGVAALNADGDASTVQLQDVRNALEHFQPIFTTSEITQLKGLEDEFFQGSIPKDDGEFVVEFEALPNQGAKVHPIVSFDGWEFAFETLHTVRYSAQDTSRSWAPSANVQFVQEYARRMILARNGEAKFDCTAGAHSYCDSNFRYEGVRFYKLDGRVSVAGEYVGLMVMELWEGGMRTYNRVVEFKKKMHGVAPLPQRYNEYFAATPKFGGQDLVLQRQGDALLLTTGVGVTASLEAMLPEYTEEVKRRLPPGRYEAFEGVVIDVHSSGAVFAYFDGCELPTTIYSTSLSTEVCPASGRKVRIHFMDGKTTLKVEGGATPKSIDLHADFGGTLSRDRSYYVTQ